MSFPLFLFLSFVISPFCLSVSLSLCLSVFLSLCLSVFLGVVELSMLEWMNGWSSLVNGLLKAHSVLINAKSCYLLFKAMLVPGKTSQFTVLETRIPPAVVTLRAYPTLIIEYVLLCYSASCYVQAKKELVTRGVMER